MKRLSIAMLCTLIVMLSISIIYYDCATTHFSVFKVWLIHYTPNDYGLIVDNLLINLIIIFILFYGILSKLNLSKNTIPIMVLSALCIGLMMNFTFKTSIRLSIIYSQNVNTEMNEKRGLSLLFSQPNQICHND